MPVQCSLGHENPDGSAFCDECGEPLGGRYVGSNLYSTAGSRRASRAGTSRHTSLPILRRNESCRRGVLLQLRCQPARGTGSGQQCRSATTTSDAATTTGSTSDHRRGGGVSAPAALQARLVVEADNQEFDLSGKDNITIGREDIVSNIYPDVDLTPHGGEEGGVSRLHARIFVENGQYLLEDENSTNFTFLNRQRLAGKTPTPLHDNDEVRLGRVVLRFKTP